MQKLASKWNFTTYAQWVAYNYEIEKNLYKRFPTQNPRKLYHNFNSLNASVTLI